MDIHNYKRRLERTIERVKESDISEDNKKIILQFYDNCSTESLSLSKTERYIFDILSYAKTINKPFLEASKEDIKAILNIFSEDVEYYETPFQRLKNRAEIELAWKEIAPQTDIKLDFEVFNKEGDKYVVKWNLKFFDKKEFVYKGVYLLSLNSDNKCNYFMQYSEGK